MVQPPQPPGPYGGQPPGYGQQPDPGQGPGGYPQQGGYPYQGGYYQQGGHPSTGPQPMQQPGAYGQQDQYGQPGQFGQPSPYGQPGPYGPPPVAPRKSPLPWIIAGGGVAAIAIVVVLILVLTGGSETSSPQAMSEEIARTINDHDTAAARALYCDPATAGDASQGVDFEDMPTTAQVNARAGNSSENGDTGKAQIIMTFNVDGQSGELTFDFELKRQNGDWCIVSVGPAGVSGNR